ncbi:hypothetical protein ACFOWZ_06475 [Lentzea rhizosphaerae]|uniref:butyrate kinase n=1 Tax=Lentzea rhizosphaerae TaxID=2041025 RepID=A0ABV8BMG2_9PSEU
MNVLVVNAGSSSLKLRVLGEDDTVLAEHHAERWTGETGPLEDFLSTSATAIDDDTRARIEALTALAPLHQPRALAGVDAATRLLPGVPQVACFDTSFHTTMPAARASPP